MTIGLVHRLTLVPGVYVCGARYRDGARGVASNLRVTCAECKRIVREKQLEAKARFAKLEDSTNPRLDTTDEP